MLTPEACGHCGYRVPDDAAICPGCGRRHEVPVGGRHSPLLRVARWTRRLLVLTGWLAVLFGLVALARYGVGLDRVSDDVDADVAERLGDATLALSGATLAVGVLAGLATSAWARRAHRNLPGLGVDARWTSPWALLGWLLPGRTARMGKVSVDATWRDTSPTLAALPARGWSRRPVSRVVLQWWTLWFTVPAIAGLAAVAIGGTDALDGELPLVGVAAAALTVATVRALYDIVGILTVVQAHRAVEVLHRREARPWDETWDDAPTGDWVDEPEAAYSHFGGTAATPASAAASNAASAAATDRTTT